MCRGKTSSDRTDENPFRRSGPLLQTQQNFVHGPSWVRRPDSSPSLFPGSDVVETPTVTPCLDLEGGPLTLSLVSFVVTPLGSVTEM